MALVELYELRGAFFQVSDTISFDDEFPDDLPDVSLDAAEMTLSQQILLHERKVKSTETSIAGAQGKDMQHYKKKLVRIAQALAESKQHLKQYQDIRHGAALFKHLPTKLSEPYFYLSLDQHPVLLRHVNLESKFLAANVPCWVPWRLLTGHAGFTEAGIAKALDKTASQPYVWM